MYINDDVNDVVSRNRLRFVNDDVVRWLCSLWHVDECLTSCFYYGRAIVD